MTHYNITSWAMPQLQDGDVIDGVNISQDKANTPMLQDVTANIIITNSNVWNCLFPENVTVDLSTCAYGQKDKEVIIDIPIDNFTSIKDSALEKLMEIKPLAYKNPLAVKVALSEAFTSEEFSGVMEAN